MLHVPYVSLPNNLLGTGQVPEYLQSAAVLELLQQPDKAARQIEPFARVHEQLQTNAALQAAQQVIERGTH